jgi:hypothetical protein
MTNDLKRKASWKFIVVVGIAGIFVLGLAKLFIWRTYIYVPKPKLVAIEIVPATTQEVEAQIKKLLKAGMVDKVDCQNYEAWMSSEVWNRLTSDEKNKLTCLLLTYCRIKHRGRQRLAIRDTYSGSLLAICSDCAEVHISNF